MRWIPLGTFRANVGKQAVQIAGAHKGRQVLQVINTGPLTAYLTDSQNGTTFQPLPANTGTTLETDGEVWATCFYPPSGGTASLVAPPLFTYYTTLVASELWQQPENSYMPAPGIGQALM